MPRPGKNRPILWLATCGFAALAGCHPSQQPSRLFIDDLYNANNARISCLVRAQMHAGPPCRPDPEEEVQAFQDQIANAIAAIPACDGIEVDLMSDNQDNAPAWTLKLDFSDARPAQKWTLSSQYPDIHEGRDDAQGMAAKICAILNSRTSFIAKYFP